jgi:hypothetical protein
VGEKSVVGGENADVVEIIGEVAAVVDEGAAVAGETCGSSAVSGCGLNGIECTMVHGVEAVVDGMGEVDFEAALAIA